MRAQGYDAIKFNICEELQIVDTYAKVDGILKRLFDLRAAVGDRMDLAFDFHGRVHAPMARVLLKELEPGACVPASAAYLTLPDFAPAKSNKNAWGAISDGDENRFRKDLPQPVHLSLCLSDKNMLRRAE